MHAAMRLFQLLVQSIGETLHGSMMLTWYGLNLHVMRMVTHAPHYTTMSAGTCILVHTSHQGLSLLNSPSCAPPSVLRQHSTTSLLARMMLYLGGLLGRSVAQYARVLLSYRAVGQQR